MVAKMSNQEEAPSQRQQVTFRLENELFLDFKRKLIDDGNRKVQDLLETFVKQYVNGDIKL
jgi:hypothetical protein